MEEKRPRQRKEDGQFLCGPLRFFVTSVLSFSEFGAESRESTQLSVLLAVTIFARRTQLLAAPPRGELSTPKDSICLKS